MIDDDFAAKSRKVVLLPLALTAEASQKADIETTKRATAKAAATQEAAF